MQPDSQTDFRAPASPLVFYGGTFGALMPFAVFLAGVAWLALSGAPDERGFWPILIGALLCGLTLARDRDAYSRAVIDGMSQHIVMLMIVAWMLAGILAEVLANSGFVVALGALAQTLGVGGSAYVVIAFLVTATVATATGTSLGTLLLTVPLLYPTGLPLAARPEMLIGALLAGATFGDNISPVSDTTIASATTQRAEMGRVVASRLRYALPAAAAAIIVYALFGRGEAPAAAPLTTAASYKSLALLIAPATVFVLLLRGRHLVTGMMVGCALAVLIALLIGTIPPSDIIYIDREAFVARGLIVDGIERSIGVSVFSLLLMGLAAGLTNSGLLDRLVAAARDRAQTERAAEVWIFGLTSATTLLLTHAVVAILTVGEFARRTGQRFSISRERRANLLDVTVCTYPFLLPYFIPTILAASLTQSSNGGVGVSAFRAGLFNFQSWALLALIVFAIVTGWGRTLENGTDGQ